MSGNPTRTAPETCAQCGADVPPRALACPECGADERTGWREQSIYDGLDLPEEETSAPSRSRSNHGLRWSTWVIMIIVLIVLVLGALGLS